MASNAFKLFRCIEKISNQILAIVPRPKLRGVEFVTFRQHILDRDGLARNPGDQLGDDINLIQRHRHGSAYIAHSRACLHPAEGDHLCDPVVAVFVHRISDQLLTLIVREIEVKIRHRDAARVEEPLEDELVPQGIQVGDTHRIGND